MACCHGAVHKTAAAAIKTASFPQKLCHQQYVPFTLYFVLLYAASEVRRLFDDEKCTPSPSSDEFWVLLAALKAFVVSKSIVCSGSQGHPHCS